MRLFILLILFIPSASLFPKDFKILSNWETDKVSDGITISYRWINVGDTLKTREMRTALHIQAGTEAILKQFKSDDKLSRWTAGSCNCLVLQNTEDVWITYTLYDMPWPFKSNDLITKYHKVKDQNGITLWITGLPAYIPPKSDITRIQHYEGYWKLIPGKDGDTKVEFCSTSFTKPMFPRFIQDPILQEIMINSMVKFRKQAEEEL